MRLYWALFRLSASSQSVYNDRYRVEEIESIYSKNTGQRIIGQFLRRLWYKNIVLQAQNL